MQYLNTELEPLRQIQPHPNVIRLYGMCELGEYRSRSGKQEEVAFVVQEYAPMGELFDYVQSAPFDDDTIRHFAFQLFSGIQHMKQNGYSHRDLKPENVCLDNDFVLKIIDWGFATRYGEGALVRSFKGSGSYMAPQIRAREDYDPHKADMFSLGTLLYVLRMRAYPWQQAKNSGNYSLFVKGRPDLFWKVI